MRRRGDAYEADEEEDADHAGGDVEGGDGQDEADDDDGLARGDVPCPLVEVAGTVRHDDGHDGGEEVRGEGQDQGDDRVVAESPALDQ